VQETERVENQADVANSRTKLIPMLQS
jgi:hypothetical protein